MTENPSRIAELEAELSKFRALAREAAAHEETHGEHLLGVPPGEEWRNRVVNDAMVRRDYQLAQLAKDDEPEEKPAPEELMAERPTAPLGKAALRTRLDKAERAFLSLLQLLITNARNAEGPDGLPAIAIFAPMPVLDTWMRTEHAIARAIGSPSVAAALSAEIQKPRVRPAPPGPTILGPDGSPIPPQFRHLNSSESDAEGPGQSS